MKVKEVIDLINNEDELYHNADAEDLLYKHGVKKLHMTQTLIDTIGMKQQLTYTSVKMDMLVLQDLVIYTLAECVQAIVMYFVMPKSTRK